MYKNFLKVLFVIAICFSTATVLADKPKVEEKKSNYGEAVAGAAIGAVGGYTIGGAVQNYKNKGELSQFESQLVCESSTGVSGTYNQNIKIGNLDAISQYNKMIAKFDKINEEILILESFF